MTVENKNKMIATRLTAKEFNAVKKEAQRRGIRPSEWLRFAVRDYLLITRR